VADLHARAFKKNVVFVVSNIGIVINYCSFFLCTFTEILEGIGMDGMILK